METSKAKTIAGCCFAENRKLVEELRNCDFCSTSYEEHRQCKREAESRSRERARECMIS